VKDAGNVEKSDDHLYPGVFAGSTRFAAIILTGHEARELMPATCEAALENGSPAGQSPLDAA
jgi:hypothetical protein